MSQLMINMLHVWIINFYLAHSLIIHFVGCVPICNIFTGFHWVNLLAFNNTFSLQSQAYTERKVAMFLYIKAVLLLSLEASDGEPPFVSNMFFIHLFSITQFIQYAASLTKLELGIYQGLDLIWELLITITLLMQRLIIFQISNFRISLHRRYTNCKLHI